MSTAPNGNQFTLDLEPGLVEKYPTLLSLLNVQVRTRRDKPKVVAANLGMAPAMLLRKTNDAPREDQDPDQRRVFNVEDLEAYIAHYEDMTPILYLVAKYMPDDETKRRQAIGQIAAILPSLNALVAQAGIELPPTSKARR